MSANLLPIACMIAAAGAAIVSVMVSVRGLLQARSLPPKGYAVSITEPMGALARGNSPTPAVFAQQPNGTAEVVTLSNPGSPTNGLTIALIVAGILLIVIGLVAEYGTRLQRDTEGLI